MKNYWPAKSKKELKMVETLVLHLSEDQKKHRIECKEEGLNDDVCGECGRIFLACFHFVDCRQGECPLKNGKSLLEMFIGEPKE